MQCKCSRSSSSVPRYTEINDYLFICMLHRLIQRAMRSLAAIPFDCTQVTESATNVNAVSSNVSAPSAVARVPQRRYSFVHFEWGGTFAWPFLCFHTRKEENVFFSHLFMHRTYALFFFLLSCIISKLYYCVRCH